MNWAAIIWFGLMVLFLMTEASTICLVSIWFASGALAALIASCLHAELWLQVVIFLAVSVALLCALRPLARRYFTPRLTRTNVDSVVGSQGLVTETIDNVTAAGRVKLGAMEWSARSTDNMCLREGTRVRVDRVEGVKVYVSAVEVTAEI